MSYLTYKYKGGEKMKKINRVIFVIIAVFISLLATSKVNAETIKLTFDDPSKMYYHSNGPDNGGDMVNYVVNGGKYDGQKAYCIAPGEWFHGKYSYTAYNYNSSGVLSAINSSQTLSKNKLTQNQLDRISLLAYYGYGYKGHTSERYFVATQMLIYRVMGNEYFTDKNCLDNPDTCKRIADPTEIASAMSEINTLVNNHNTKPSFNNTSVVLKTGETITITDNNNVLDNYIVDSCDNCSATINGNKLLVTSKKAGKVNVSLSRGRNGHKNLLMFATSESQNMVIAGNIDPVYSVLNGVSGGTIKLQKKDQTTKQSEPQGEATFNNAVYGVYKTEDNTEVGTITLDNNGQGSIIVDFGNYYIKEKNAPKGYLLSTKEYPVELTFIDNNTESSVNKDVFDKVILGKLKLVKTMGGTDEPFVIEKDAQFQVIDKNGEIVEVLTTNDKGMAIVSLPYGSYTLHQTKGADGYINVDDVKIELYEDKIYEVDLINYKPSKLVFTKVDYSSGDPLPNTLVEIYKDDDTLIHSCRTNDKGICELPNLEIGKYYILEKDAPKYYRINPDKMYFEVKEHGKIIKATMKDERKEGNLIFTKTDITGKKKLEGALIEIVFTENNHVVFKNKTDKNGEVKLEGLVAGKYCIYERKAPDGYELSKKPVCFEILEDGETVKVSMTNNGKIIVPDTRLNDYTYIICAVIILGGIGYLIYEKRKH